MIADGPPLPRGDLMHEWASDLWPVPRSLTGDGVRRTLEYLAELVPPLRTHEVPSGAAAMDWTVPPEWNVRSAYIIDPDGQRFADWQTNSLHLVGYSTPVDEFVTLDELQGHLYSMPSSPGAIPYVTSYYERRWGFCVAQDQRDRLRDGMYHVVIDADLSPGALTYGDLVVPGQSDEEILFSTYVCHPSMANNELSGLVVQTALAQWVMQLPNPWYTYRFVYAPETIGSLVYLQQHHRHLSDHVRAGWVISCVGDDRAYSLVPSRRAGTLAERTLVSVLSDLGHELTMYSWLERGSDERQWCAPGVDLPVCGFSRSKYGAYPEYHSSLDDLSVISPRGLEQSLTVLQNCVMRLEDSPRYVTTTLGEPQMSRRGLYPSLSHQGGGAARASAAAISSREIMNVLSYCDGDHDAQEIAALVGLEETRVGGILTSLRDTGLVRRS